jgi:plasmid stability protein
MPTLYVENIPRELYGVLRGRVRRHRNSIAAEVLSLLAENIPTARELKSRQEFLARMRRRQSQRPRSRGPFPSSEQMQREERRR